MTNKIKSQQGIKFKIKNIDNSLITISLISKPCSKSIYIYIIKLITLTVLGLAVSFCQEEVEYHKTVI